MMRADAAASSASAAGVRVLTSTTSGMIERKKIITFGLPSVSDSEPRNARKPLEATGADAVRCGRRSRHRPGDVKKIGGAGVFERDEEAGEGMGEHAQARSRQHEPDHVANDIAGDEGRNAAEAVSRARAR